jgi:two-component system, NarL family, response regulator LiaR
MQSQPVRVLVADDNERVRLSLSVFFETVEDLIMVAEASNGQEAIDLCPQVRPDIIIMDLLMPVMDGVTATRLIREKYPQIKVVILTSASDESLIKSAMDAGAAGYLLKYATIDQIENALRKAAGIP